MSKSLKKSQCAESLQGNDIFVDYSQFDPHSYVAEYYSTLGEENQFLLKFYHSVYKNIKPGARVLEFGGGPTVYQLLSAAEVAGEIVFADYLDCNRKEVSLWLKGHPQAMNWDQYIDYVLQLKSVKNVSRDQFRENVGKKVTRIIECDANLPNMLGALSNHKFDVVSSGFCLDCISTSEEQFISYLKKLSGYLKPGGTLILSSLLGADSYTIGNLTFSSFPIDQTSLRVILEKLGYKISRFEVVKAEHDQGYEGLMATEAKLV